MPITDRDLLVYQLPAGVPLVARRRFHHGVVDLRPCEVILSDGSIGEARLLKLGYLQRYFNKKTSDCLVCGRKFQNTTTLEFHKRDDHDNPRPIRTAEDEARDLKAAYERMGNPSPEEQAWMSGESKYPPYLMRARAAAEADEKRRRETAKAVAQAAPRERWVEVPLEDQ